MARAQYVVTRDYDGEMLFVADRDRHRASLWTNRLSDALIYKFEQAASRMARTLDGARAIPLHEAMVIAESRARKWNEVSITQ